MEVLELSAPALLVEILELSAPVLLVEMLELAAPVLLLFCCCCEVDNSLAVDSALVVVRRMVICLRHNWSYVPVVKM